MRWLFTGVVASFLPFISVSSLLASSQTQDIGKQLVGQTAGRARVYLAQILASERLAVWQKRLNLQSWNISVQFARTVHLRPKTMGNIRWDAEKKVAIIRILHPDDYALPIHEMLEDVEFTVVHELIHLELASLPRSDASRSDEEQAVNQITRALLDLDRRRQ